MSQPLAGTFTQLGQKAEDKAPPSPKPGPEWGEPLRLSKLQIIHAGVFCAVNAHHGITQANLSSLALSVYQGYLLLKGARNYQLTVHSAQEAALRNLRGDNAPANDNLLTPNQSQSNSYKLLSNGSYAVAADAAVAPVFEAVVNGKSGSSWNTASFMTMAVFGIWGRDWQTKGKKLGPTKLPPLFDDRKPPSSGGPV